MYIIYKLVPVDDENPTPPPESVFTFEGVEYGRWHVEHTFCERAIVERKIQNYQREEKNNKVRYNWMLV